MYWRRNETQYGRPHVGYHVYHHTNAIFALGVVFILYTALATEGEQT
ncbi:MAG: hypothetical protein ACE5I5_05355 [Candidatus Heimdallarchaeota archaeon]